jgi:uncharacterized surface protein with fasciclin (FAS1) repeats
VKTDYELPIDEVLRQNGQFSSFCSALEVAGLMNTLKVAGPFTVFAPDDVTFNKIPPNVFKDLLKPENKDKLKIILSYHIVPGMFLGSQIKSTRFKTLQGKDVHLILEDNRLRVNNANVIKSDFLGMNGVVHAIDGILVP